MERFSEQLLLRWSEFRAEFEGELRDGTSDGQPAGVFSRTAADPGEAHQAPEAHEAHEAHKESGSGASAGTRWQHMQARVVEHVCTSLVNTNSMSNEFCTLFRSAVAPIVDSWGVTELK